MAGIRRYRASAAVLVPLVACLLAAGCGGNDHVGTPAGQAAASTTAGRPPSGTAGGTASGTASATAGSPPSGTASTGPAASGGGGASAAGGMSASAGTVAGRGCLSSELAVTQADEDHAAGHTYKHLVFTNKGRRTCITGGFPGVSQVGPAGRQLGAAADRTGPAGRALTLAPGGHARVTLTITSPGIQIGCDSQTRITSAEGLRVYPPANRAAIFVRYANPTSACTAPSVHQLTVTALTR